jgi:hypothetical protein
MENGDYIFQRFTEKEIPDLVYLFTTINNHKYSDEFFRKKFETSFTGISYVGYIAYHKDTKEAAAFYGVFPVFLEYQNNKFLAAQSGDTITNPKHQKKGLFIALAKLTYALCKELQVQIVFGFPNGNSSYGFFNKLDWKPDGQIHKYVVNTGASIIKKLSRKFLPTSMYLSKFKTFSELNQTNDNRNNSVHIFKDKSYLQYKEYSPKYFYEYKGIVVSFKIEYDLHIGNFYCKKPLTKTAVMELIQHLSKITFTEKVLLFFSEFDSEISNILSEYKIENESFENGRLNLYDRYTQEHLIFSFEDFDSF